SRWKRRKPSSCAACAPIRWCNRCCNGFPAPRSSMCAGPNQPLKPRRRPTCCPTPSARTKAMPDLMGRMKQAAHLQSKMETLQAELDTIEVEGAAGGGLVTVTLTAKGDLKGVKIDDSLFKPGEKE